jgi:hypothetical protein
MMTTRDIIAGCIVVLAIMAAFYGGISLESARAYKARCEAVQSAVDAALAECARTHNSKSAELVEIISELHKRGKDIDSYDIFLNIGKKEGDHGQNE